MVARSGATFAAQLIKQVERKLLIVSARAKFQKNLPAKISALSTGDNSTDLPLFVVVGIDVVVAWGRRD